MIPTYELLISKAFFNQVIDRRVETNIAIGQIVFNFAKSPSHYVFTKFQRALNLNAQDVKNVENGFADGMKQFLEIFDPNLKGWKAFEDNPSGRTKALKDIRSEEMSIQLAMGNLYIVRQALAAEGKLPQKEDQDILTELRPMAKEFIKIFAEPIMLHKSVLENLVNSKFNLYEKNRSNFIWDILMMYYVGQNYIGNAKTIFVTSDKAMIESALSTNPRNAVLTFEEYMEYLGLK